MKQSDIYKQVAVQTSSPAGLVVMLYEGAIRNLRDSIDAIKTTDLERKRQSIDRAVAILQHLQSTLDRERGESIATELDNLYNYIISRVLQGSSKLDVEPLEEAVKLLTVLLSGWEQLMKKNPQQIVPSVLLTQQSSPVAFGFRA
jgi:flagellar secretion chaperone FliS